MGFKVTQILGNGNSSNAENNKNQTLCDKISFVLIVTNEAEEKYRNESDVVK